jgi:hypothetical protein
VGCVPASSISLVLSPSSSFPPPFPVPRGPFADQGSEPVCGVQSDVWDLPLLGPLRHIRARESWEGEGETWKRTLKKEGKRRRCGA